MGINELKYFEDLFQKLGPIEDEHPGCASYVQIDGDCIRGTEDLKDYMFSILKSNMQYDFGIDFDDYDVMQFARAITGQLED